MAFDNLTKQYIKERTGGKIFERGVWYFNNNQVKKIRLENNIIYAEVVGSYGLYKVQIEDSDRDFSFHCTCPYEEDCCKHLVAVVLTFLDKKDQLLKQLDQDNKTYRNLKDKLLLFEKDKLADLILLSLKTHKDWKNTLLKELEKKLGGEKSSSLDDIYKDQFYNHLNHVCEILEEQNTLGGGPEDEMEEVWYGLEEIDKLFVEKKLDGKLKKEFIDRMFYYYDWGNSGLNDDILDAVYNICQSRDDWLYVVRKLEKKDGDYRMELIMKIYKNQLNDEGKYLELRSHDLKYGMDYYDLVIFHKDKGEIEKAVKVASDGLEKGEGRIIDLLEFLFNYYKGNNYTQALYYLKKIFEGEPSITRYHQLKEFAQKENWKELEVWCRDILEKQQMKYQLALINFENKDYEKVLGFVLEEPKYYGSFEDPEKEELATKLLPAYPDKLLSFYMEKINRCIEQMGRESYRKAASYTQTIKDIYLKYLNKPGEWKGFIDQIRIAHQKKPALLDEFNKL